MIVYRGGALQDIREFMPDLANAACPAEGIATGGQPDVKHFERLAEAGYRAVMDLRTADEDRGLWGGVTEEQAVRSAGMEYVSLPLASEAGAYTDEAFDRFREILSDPSRRPALVHCRTATRVRPLILAYLTLDEGRSIEEAESLADEVSPRKQELHERALTYIEFRRNT